LFPRFSFGDAVCDSHSGLPAGQAQLGFTYIGDESGEICAVG